MPLLPFPSSVRRQAPAQVLHCSASLFRIFMTSRLGGNCFGIRLGGLFGGLCGRLVPSQLYRSRLVPQDICIIAPSHGSPPHLVSQTYFPHLPPLARAAPNTRPAARLTAPVSAVPPRRANRHTRRRGFRLHYPWHQGLALRAHPRAHPSGDSHRAHPSGAPQTCGHPRSHPSGDSQEHPPLARTHILVCSYHSSTRLAASGALPLPSGVFGPPPRPPSRRIANHPAAVLFSL